MSNTEKEFWAAWKAGDDAFAAWKAKHNFTEEDGYRPEDILALIRELNPREYKRIEL